MKRQDGKTWADTFITLLTPLVYEQESHTEEELAYFLNPGCTIVETVGPGGHKLVWITFTDESFVGYCPKWTCPFIGMAPEDGKIEI